MKKTLLITLLLLMYLAFGNNAQAQFGLKKLVKNSNLTKEKKPTEKVLDIEIYSDEARTVKVSNLQITKTTKLFCRANLSDYIEDINFYADKANSFIIYLCLQHLEINEGDLADDHQVYFRYEDNIPNGKRNWIEYQKENKYFDFVIDMADEKSASVFNDRLKNNDFPDNIVPSSISIICSYSSKFIISIGYLDIDFSLLLEDNKASQEQAIAAEKQKQEDERIALENKKAKELSSRKLVIPTAAFTDKNLEKLVSEKIASESDVEKVYKLVFIENREINRFSDNSPKNRWCRANVFVKMTDGRCMKLIIRVYEDFNGGVYRFNGNPNYETSTEYSCSAFAAYW